MFDDIKWHISITNERGIHIRSYADNNIPVKEDYLLIKEIWYRVFVRALDYNSQTAHIGVVLTDFTMKEGPHLGKDVRAKKES